MGSPVEINGRDRRAAGGYGRHGHGQPCLGKQFHRTILRIQFFNGENRVADLEKETAAAGGGSDKEVPILLAAQLLCFTYDAENLGGQFLSVFTSDPGSR